jgi:uncharacterized protein (TIGR02268 family)
VLPSPSLLILAILQGSPVAQPPTANCQDMQHVELSLVRGTSRAEEICVSPGLLTGFVFDASAKVDLEDEIRFAEVTHSRTSFSIMPPGDGVEGERFRLTARFEDGASVTFVLVLHSGQGTRQVQVYRDKRTRESFQYEVAQERAKNQQHLREIERLRHQLEQLRVEGGDLSWLRRLIVSNWMGRNGIRALDITSKLRASTEGPLTALQGTAYRADSRVAIDVWIRNSSETPWSATLVSLVDERGKELPGIRLWQADGGIPPNTSQRLVVEADIDAQTPLGEVTLHLREDGPRTISLLQVAFPQ